MTRKCSEIDILFNIYVARFITFSAMKLARKTCDMSLAPNSRNRRCVRTIFQLCGCSVVVWGLWCTEWFSFCHWTEPVYPINHLQELKRGNFGLTLF